MEFNKLKAPSLKDMFVREIENKILSGEIEIGQQLPTERDMAEQMGVSRAVVNAGIAAMAGKGFLEIRPRVGTFVADYRRKGTMETLISIMNYNGGMLRRSEIRSILEFKILIDCFSLRCLIPRVTQKDTDVLWSHLEQLRDCTKVTDASEAVFNFNHELCVLSGNAFAPLIYYSFRAPIINLWQRFMRMYGVQTVYNHNYKLFQFILKKDLDSAIRWVEEYIGQSIQGSKEIYSE